MNRFSLSNIFLPISHGKFLTMVTEFRGAVEQSFGRDVALDIVALSRPKLFQTWVDDDVLDWIDRENKKSEILCTHDLSALTHELWQRAGHVGIRIHPVQENECPQFAHMEAKGNSPDVVNFAIHGGQDDEAAMRRICAQHPLMLKGDGMTPSRSSRWAQVLCLAH